MKHLLFVLALCLSLASFAPAQSSDKGTRSEQIQLKMHKVELLTMIMPLALTKDQLNQLFPIIEKVRVEQRKMLASEDDALAKFEPKVDETLKAALEKGIFPTQESLTAQGATLSGLAKYRQILAGTLADEFYDKVKGVFNPGQMTIMSKTVRDRAAEADKEPKDEKQKAARDTENQKYFIKAIFLDSATYDLMLALYKSAT